MFSIISPTPTATQSNTPDLVWPHVFGFSEYDRSPQTKVMTKSNFAPIAGISLIGLIMLNFLVDLLTQFRPWVILEHPIVHGILHLDLPPGRATLQNMFLMRLLLSSENSNFRLHIFSSSTAIGGG